MQIYKCFAISYLCSKHGPIGERLICPLREKNDFTDETLNHSSTALYRFNLSRQWKNDDSSHLYAEHNLSTHGKKYRLIFSLNFEKHSEKYRLIFGEIFIV